MENRYTIYFEIYGKKLKTSVVAKSEKEAKLKVIEKLNFIKVVMLSLRIFSSKLQYVQGFLLFFSVAKNIF